MQVVVHIGVHKTGTSALQAFLAMNRGALAEHGISYQPSEGKLNHHGLAAGFDSSRSDVEPGERQIAKMLDATRLSTLLISSECLCESRIQIDRLLACLSGHDVKVIAYMRRPDELCESAYNGIVRSYKHRWTEPIGRSRLGYDPT